MIPRTASDRTRTKNSMGDLTLEEVTQELGHLPAEQRARKLRAWVARLNAPRSGTVNPAVARELLHRLEALDEELKAEGGADPADIQRQLNEWLDTAGEVGGAEQEQDPTRPKAEGWHGWHLGEKDR